MWGWRGGKVAGEPHYVGVCRGRGDEEAPGDLHDVGLCRGWGRGGHWRFEVCRGWRERRSLENHMM